MRQFYTDPLPIVDLPADSNHYSNDRLGYERIVLHHTGYTGAQGTGNSGPWLSTDSPPGKRVSCHRLIRYGTIYKIVPDYLVAFTQGPACIRSLTYGDVDPNRICLSIEIENNGKGEKYSDTDLRLTAMQCVEWIGAYGWIPVDFHGSIQDNKNDPFAFPMDKFYTFMTEQLRRYLA